jgi:hypothetical protein
MPKNVWRRAQHKNIESYTQLGFGQGRWRDEHQFYSPEAGI